MPLTLRLVDPDTKEERPLTFRDYEELTLADWKLFSPIEAPKDELSELDAAIGRAALFTGIPFETFVQWPIKQARLVLDHVGDELARAYQGSDKFKAALAEGTEFIPDPYITIGGKKYAVPLDIDKIPLAQFADWERWEAPEHEADIIAETLAFMLVEAGHEYDGTPKEKIEAMMQCPMELAFDLCAFFFTKSEEFKRVTVRRSLKFRDLTRHLITRTLKISTSDIEALASLDKPLG